LDNIQCSVFNFQVDRLNLMPCSGRLTNQIRNINYLILRNQPKEPLGLSSVSSCSATERAVHSSPAQSQLPCHTEPVEGLHHAFRFHPSHSAIDYIINNKAVSFKLHKI